MSMRSWAKSNEGILSHLILTGRLSPQAKLISGNSPNSTSTSINQSMEMTSICATTGDQAQKYGPAHVLFTVREGYLLVDP
jgi:hypothetical protein